MKILREAKKGTLSYETKTDSQIIRETEKAICLSGYRRDIWIPKKACEVRKEDDTLVIYRWFDSEWEVLQENLLSKKAPYDYLEHYNW